MDHVRLCVLSLKMLPGDVDGGDDVHGRADAGPAFAHDVDHAVDDGEDADGDSSMRDITTT